MGVEDGGEDAVEAHAGAHVAVEMVAVAVADPAVGGVAEVLDGEGDDADEVAGAGGGDAALEFEVDDGFEEGLEFGAIGEVDIGEEDGGELADFDGGADAFECVLALLVAVGGVVVDAEAGIPAGGEVAGLAGKGGA